MSFWNEKKDDGIWDELRYWAKNPVTDKEWAIRKKEVETYIDAVLEKTFKD